MLQCQFRVQLVPLKEVSVPIDSIDPADPCATFRTRPIGFDRDQVRACLQNMISDYTRAVEQITWLTNELKSAESTRRDAVRSEMSTTQLTQVLASAHRVAEDLTAQAQERARRILLEAQEEAAHLRSQAEADASALAGTAAARLETIEGDIVRMTEQHRAVQIAVSRAADRLNRIANEMRAAAEATDLAPADDPSEIETSRS